MQNYQIRGLRGDERKYPQNIKRTEEFPYLKVVITGSQQDQRDSPIKKIDFINPPRH